MTGPETVPEVPLPRGVASLQRAENLLFWMEQTLLVLLIAVLVGLSFAQAALAIGFRLGWSWAGDAVGSLSWSQGFLRHLVLVIAFIGASLATRQGRHLSIDAASKALPPRMRVLLKALIDVVSAVVSGLLAHATYVLIQTEDSVAFRIGSTEVSTKVFFYIVLVGFALIGLRFLIRGAQDFWHGWTGQLEPEAPPV